MDTIKKVLHPKESTHKTNTTHDPAAGTDHHFPSSSQPLPQGARPDQETLDRLGSEPNVTGISRPPPHEDFHQGQKNTATADFANTVGDQPKINRGHHHPRQPVGATGQPGDHGVAGAAAARTGSGGAQHDARAKAEEGNNFPGTNPDPLHSA